MNILIGGAWPYANGSLHIGHIAALLPGDIIARYYRQKGDNVLYVSGSDCHGTPISIKAKSLGITMNESTLELLTKCNYSHHIKPISVMDYYDSWKADLVKARTNAMIDIIWNKLMSWLQD